MSGVVYVAEDDPHMRAWLLASLDRAGHRAEAFESALHLLERVRGSLDDDPPALIVSDQRMRGRTGLDAFVTLRAWGCTAPLLLITAFPDPALLDEAARRGVDEVLAKPFESREFLATIERCLARWTAASARSCNECGDWFAGAGWLCSDCEPTGSHEVAAMYRDLGGSD